MISAAASSIVHLLHRALFLSNHIIHAFQEGCQAVCSLQPLSCRDCPCLTLWAGEEPLELAALVLTVLGECCTQEACTYQARDRERDVMACQPLKVHPGQGRRDREGNFERRSGHMVLACPFPSSQHGSGPAHTPYCTLPFPLAPRLRCWFSLRLRCSGGLPPTSAKTACCWLPAQ